ALSRSGNLKTTSIDNRKPQLQVLQRFLLLVLQHSALGVLWPRSFLMQHCGTKGSTKWPRS
ncbi:hypothetical protein PanWU01x14_081220, partial [Parasponia andersonii]